MQFRTEFKIDPLDEKINYRSSLLFTGSCFSEEIGARCNDLKFKILQNPGGIIYNPFSLATELKYYTGEIQFNSNDLFQSAGLFRHFDFHSDLAAPEKSVAENNIGYAIERANAFLKNATHILITFGTSVIYKLNNGKIVANNHKLPAGNFIKSQSEVIEILDVWQPLVHKLVSLNPGVKIIFTVSPVRHIKDGFPENQISKSTLLLAVKEMLKWPQTYYFPAYELMMDDLRDYRFYKSDLIHPNAMAVDYIFEKFVDACIEPAVYPVMELVREIQSAKNHRPFFPETEEHKMFAAKMFLKVKSLQDKYPEIDLSEEMEYFNK